MYKMRNRTTGKIITKTYRTREAARNFNRARNFAYQIINPQGVVVR